MEPAQDQPVLDIVNTGRSAGEVKPPDVEPDVPPLSDEEIQQALADLGVTGLKIGRIKSIRKLGQFTKEAGILSFGRGLIACSVGQLMDVAERADELERETEESEIKARFLTIRNNCANAMTKAAEVILGSEDLKAPPANPLAPRLPEYGETVGPLTQINAQNVHLHSNG